MPMGLKMYCTLPSGNIASVDEMMEVARQWHEASQPREQHEPVENEPMECGTTLQHSALSQSTMASTEIDECGGDSLTRHR